MNEPGKQGTASSEPAPRERDDLVTKPWLPQVLVAIATIVAVVSIFSIAVRVQLLDTDQWVSVSDQLLDEPAVTDALSAYLVDELYTRLDITAEIQGRLPEDLEGLAGPISGALRGPATTGAERLVTSDGFRTTWLTVNRNAHERLVNILREETRPGVSAADGKVTLELGELLQIVGEKLGLSESTLELLPEDAGRVTIFESDELSTVQSTVQVLDFLSWFVLLVVVALYALAVYLDRDRRLERLQSVGFSIIGIGVFVLLLRRVAVPLVVDSIVANPQKRPLASLIGYAATEIVQQMAWSAVVYGILIAGFAGLLGSQRWARSVRRFLAPLFGASPGIVVGSTALLLLVLIVWSPGRAFKGWVTGMLLVALLIGGVIALRRSIQQDLSLAAPSTVPTDVPDRVGTS